MTRYQRNSERGSRPAGLAQANPTTHTAISYHAKYKSARQSLTFLRRCVRLAVVRAALAKSQA